MKSNSLFKDAKDSVKLGAFSVTGLNVTGKSGKITSVSSGIQSGVSAGLELANLGQTTKVGLNMSEMLRGKK